MIVSVLFLREFAVDFLPLGFALECVAGLALRGRRVSFLRGPVAVVLQAFGR
jgi:hypothetical protein